MRLAPRVARGIFGMHWRGAGSHAAMPGAAASRQISSRRAKSEDRGFEGGGVIPAEPAKKQNGPCLLADLPSISSAFPARLKPLPGNRAQASISVITP